MKKFQSFLAILVCLAGLVCLTCSYYAGSILHSVGLSRSDWESALSSRVTAVDKVRKMVSSLQGALSKFEEDDAAWVQRVSDLGASAAEAYESIAIGSDAAAWDDGYTRWSDAVAELNASDAAQDSLKKSVKNINRQVKSTADAFRAWEETAGSLAELHFDPDHSFQASCIRFMQLLLYAGIVLVVAGVFLYPGVRAAIARSRQTVGYLFVAPALVFLLLFVAYPIVYNVVLSFKDVDITNINFSENQHFIGLANYRSLFTDGDGQMLGSIKNTLVFTVGSIFFQFTIGFLLALLFRNKFPLCGFIRGAIMISWLIPVTVSGLLFKFMFGMNGGIINQFLGVFGIKPIEWLYSVDFAMPAVIVANIWIGIPFNMVLLLTGLTTIPPEIYESAEIDGARGFRRLFSITIPMIKPAIMSVLTLGFVYTFKVFDLVKVMTSGGPVNRTQLVSIFAYKLAFEKYEYSMGAAAATIMFIILLIEGLFYIKAIKEDEVM